ncbi:MAG: hypothetical protein ABII90_08480 [Bacteroidota bacterium]
MGFFLNNIKPKIQLFSLLLLIILVSVLSCKKDKDADVVPNVYVNIYIYMSDPDFVDLNAVGGWVYITGGSKGIVVYRYSMEEFRAYDRHCTYQPSNGCERIEVESSGIIATDPSCGSQFVLTDGSVMTGPASILLKEYQAEFDGSLLHIYN